MIACVDIASQYHHKVCNQVLLFSAPEKESGSDVLVGDKNRFGVKIFQQQRELKRQIDVADTPIHKISVRSIREKTHDAQCGGSMSWAEPGRIREVEMARFLEVDLG